jgi:hypothetical protein
MENQEPYITKFTFGLQEKEISIIEETIKRFGNGYYAWIEIGKHIGWDSLTACLCYQQYREEKEIEQLKHDIKIYDEMGKKCVLHIEQIGGDTVYCQSYFQKAVVCKRILKRFFGIKYEEAN